MTDLLMPVTSSAGLGKNPLTNAGRVAYNGHVDEQLIIDRKNNGDAGISYYGGPTTDEAFKILPRDICITERQDNVSRNRYKTAEPFVLATVNGAFRADEEPWQIIARHTFAGLAGGQGASYDSTARSSEISLPLIRGGTGTMRNNSDRRIRNGDWIYWDLPPRDRRNPAVSFERGVTGSPRMTYWTMPYRPAFDKVTASSISKELLTPNIRRRTGDMARTPIMNAARLFEKSFRQGGVNAFHALMMSGLVTYDRQAEVDVERRKDNARQYKQDLAYRKGLLEKMGKQFGSLKNRKQNEKMVDFVPNDRNGKSTTLAEYIIKVNLAADGSSVLLEKDKTTNKNYVGDIGMLLDGQQGLVSDLEAAILAGNHFVTDRIFAKALSPANPEEEFDYISGRYGS